MDQNYVLLSEAVTALQNVKPWVTDKYFDQIIRPVIGKIKERLSIIDSEKLNTKKQLDYESAFLDTTPSKGSSSEPSILKYGLFNQSMNGPKCHLRPNSKHGYLKDLSESLGQYVCQCDFKQA